jgi:two-component system CheB/CheR fusion protein
MHGGTVEARSAGPDRGSEFIVHLPPTVLAAPPALAVSARRELSAKLAPRPRRILVVDDNHDSAELWSRLLAMRAHDAVVAGDGPAALEAAQRLRPEVVLLDLGLPGIDGMEVAKRLRAMPEASGALILATSGYNDDEHRVTQEAGFDGYYTKPVDPAEIIDRIEGWSGPDGKDPA